MIRKVNSCLLVPDDNRDGFGWTILCLLAIFAWAQPVRAQTVSFGYVQTTLPASGLSAPWQAAKDAAGNVYIADSSNARVVELPAGGGPQITVPLTGLGYPDAVAVDQNGNLFVGDLGNGTVIELPAGGTQQTVASGLVGPSDLAVDALGNLFIADGVDGVYELPAGGGTLRNLYNNGTDIFGVAVDGSGDVYMADTSTNTILELKSGANSPITLPIGLDGPFGVMVDTAGNIFVADTGHLRLLEYTAGGGHLFTIGSGIGEARALSPDGTGGVLVASSTANEVWDFSPAAVNFGSINVCPAGQSTPAPCSNTVTLNYLVTADGTLGAPHVLSGSVASTDYTVAAGSTCTGDVTAGSVCTVNVTFAPQLAGSRTGAVQVVDGASNVLSTVLVYGTGVGPQIAFGPGVQSTLSTALLGPVGVAVDGAGDVFVADEKASMVYEFSAGGGSAIAIPVTSPTSLALDGAGNIFYTTATSVYELMQPYNSAPIAIGSGFSNPTAVAVDAAGNVFVADSALHEVVKIPASGAPQTNLAPFARPTAVAVDTAGNVYVGDTSTQQVYKLPANGGPQTQVGGLFSSPPFGVAVNAAGDVYVAVAGSQIYKVPADGSAQIIIGSGFTVPTGVAVDAAGDVFITDVSNHAAYEINLSQPPTLTFPTTNVSSTSTAQSVTIENIGNASLAESALAISTNFEQVAGSGTPADCTATTTLLQGASCNLSISFAPTTGGPLTGSAVLTNNALNQSPATQSISLKGTGNQPTLAVQVGTSNGGTSFSVDGTTYTSTQTFNWVPASSHTIAVTSPQGANGTRYTFTSWSDSGAQSHQVTASAATLSYTASFSTSYLLTTAISPAGDGTITPGTASPTSDGYYPAGTLLTLTATPSSAAYLFSNWTGTTYSSSNPLSITMSAPVTETANFGTNPGSDGGALLAYEPFGETAGTSFNGMSGGGDSGWAAPWIEQEGSTAEPGYQTASGNPLSYPGLATTSSYAIGGYAYQSVGRQLNVSSTGPFSAYLSNGLIGAAGQTIWVSCLLREDANPANGEINAIFLTPVGGLSAWLAQTGIGIGSFGGNWGLQYNNGPAVVSNVAVTPAQTVLLVAGITFGATNQINLYVNPTSLGGSAPGTPSAQLTTTGRVAFQAVAYLGGYTAQDTSLSDIRIGPSYASVTHTLLTPQTITFAPLASPVTYPGGPISLTASASSGLPVTFSVLSGPALVNGSTLTITGVGTVVVAANQVGNNLYAPAPPVSQSLVVSVAGTPPSVPVTALLAYEPFNETAGSALNGASGGGDSGWAAGWVEQEGSSVEPGYEIASANPLSYAGLQPTTQYARGGYQYQSAGRPLNVSAAGPFSSYLSNGLIGAPGQTVWLSFLLRQDASPNNGQINAVFLTAQGGAGAWVTQTGIGVGYFGGSPYWGLQLNNGAPVLSSVAVTQGQTVLMVVSITFGATNQISLYVNPASLGSAAPGTPSAQVTTAVGVAFQALSYLGGYGSNESSLAAIRFGSTYAAVTPATGSTQSTQSITFTPPASPVTYPVAPISLAATASSGLTVTLSVLSGPGSVTGNTLTVTGTGTIVIAANQAGNASYAPAAQVTQTIVVNPSGGVASGTVLASEPFGETSGTPLNGATGHGDSGWGGAWVEQAGATVEPGYQITSANPLTYTGLATTANHAIGGYSYQSAGRALNTAVSGPFLSYLAGGLIGAPGQTLWLSFLFREDASPGNGQINAIYLSASNTPWATQTGVGVGYFGTSPYWGLQLNNGAPILSTVPVVQGQTVLMVVSITFGATNHINLYVNPTLGGGVPATPSAQLTTTASVAFQSLSYLGGYSANESSIADVTFGSSYDAVTPVQ
jgi:sugar lactone lactonase YvrE